MDPKYATLEVRLAKDAYGILDPSYMDLGDFPEFERYSITCKPWYIKNLTTDAIAKYSIEKAKSKIYSTNGTVTMKMLKIFEDGNEHHYDDVWFALFPDKNKGHDMDCFRGLMQSKFIAFSSKHKYGKIFYKITPAGRDVLKICDVNQPYCRIFRWIKFKGNNIFEAMMKTDLQYGENTSMDLSAESMLDLLKNIFDKTSKMRKIGSAYRWLNHVINAYKQNDQAYSLINSELVMSWINENSLTNPEINRFKTRIERIGKIREKKEKIDV